jgi:TRAP-type mannitol/chloroaromatic compound transport system substrate-binding protein
MKKTLIGRTLFGAAATALLGLFVAGGAVQPAAAEAIKLNLVGSWPAGVSSAADIGIHFIEEVNKRAAGKLEITYKGSRDVVPTFDQPEALVNGVFDVWYGAPNYWAGIVPAGYITELSKSDIPDNGPGSDLFNFMVKQYKAVGVQYLGHYSGDVKTGSHFMYTQEKVAAIGDLKGRKIRVPPLTRFVVKAVGAEPVTLPPGEVYVALDRGTVEGFTWPYYDGFTAFGWQEVSKYLINHPLYRNGIAIAMNMDKWNSLPQPALGRAGHRPRSRCGDAILGAGMGRGPPGGPAQDHAQGRHGSDQLLRRRGCGVDQDQQRDAEAAEWTQTSNDALWAHFKSVMSAEDYAEARNLMGYN